MRTSFFSLQRLPQKLCSGYALRLMENHTNPCSGVYGRGKNTPSFELELVTAYRTFRHSDQF